MLKKAFVLFLALLMIASGAFAEGIHNYDKKQGGYTYVTFGTFPEDKNGTEAPILWRVLETDGREAYLMTEYIVDVHYVHLDTVAYRYLEWNESDLFAYLQNEFLPRAFSMQEQLALVQRTEDGGLVSLPQIDDIRNKAYGFNDNKSRECAGTDYAKSIGLFQYNDHNSPWVSRNKSQDRPQQQRRVMDEGKLGTVPCGNVDLGIRPVVYVNLSKISINGGSGTKDDPYQLASMMDLLPTAPATEAPAPATPAPVMENDQEDALSQLIDQLAQEKEEAPATPVPTAAPVTTPVPAATAAPTPAPALASPSQTPLSQPEATPFTIGGIIYQTEDGVEITSLKAVTPTPVPTPLPTKEPEKATVKPAETQPEATPAAEIAPSATPLAKDGVFTAASNPAYIHPAFPELTEEGFLPEGQPEFVLKDPDNGLWLYADQQLRIEIVQKRGTNFKKQPLRWFEARIFTRDNTELFDLYPWDEANYKNHYKLAYADEIARKHRLVFAINSDYFIYREARQHDKDVDYTFPKGLIIRDGEVFYDVPRKSNTGVYPPLDVMAMYPDGTMQVYITGTKTAKEILNSGATDTLSFGPILVENGVINPRCVNFGVSAAPRTGFGYVEPGHYVCVIAEGRVDDDITGADSDGETCKWLAERMHEMGCQTALNLDGGATSTMLFMGEQINKSGNYGNVTNRKQNELIGIGYSENVSQ